MVMPLCIDLMIVDGFIINIVTVKKIRDYIFHRASLNDIILHSSTIISDVTITFFSIYKTMTAKHRFQQPRRVLETKLLKHIKNASDDDKETKYNFLAREYELL